MFHFNLRRLVRRPRQRAHTRAGLPVATTLLTGFVGVLLIACTGDNDSTPAPDVALSEAAASEQLAERAAPVTAFGAPAAPPAADGEGSVSPAPDAAPVADLAGQVCSEDRVVAGIDQSSNLICIEPRAGTISASDADLRDISLVLRDLRGANFAGADLTGADLRYADLTDAVFTDATLIGADFSGATVARTDMRGALLSEAIFTDVDLMTVNLQSTALLGVDLSNRDLRGIDLNHALLSNADLSDSNLSGADLTGVDLSFADLTNTNLFGAKMAGADLVPVTWANTVCPDGTDSDTNGGTCIGHLPIAPA